MGGEVKIAIGSDHAGLELKSAIAAHLRARGHEVEDVGTHSKDSTDYPDWARRVAETVAGKGAERGVLVCGTGQGMAMTANRVPGVRAAVVSDTFSAKMVAAHNDANVLCLGQRVVGEGLALELVDAWMATAFEGGRHERRVKKIEAC
jgi:ribose 5-phosphate isomerase B